MAWHVEDQPLYALLLNHQLSQPQSIKTSPTHCNFRNPSQFQIEKPSSEASRVPISMAKKRKSDATRLDEVDRTMYTSFCSAANSLSQLYTQAMNQQRLSFQAGERHALVWALFPLFGVLIWWDLSGMRFGSWICSGLGVLCCFGWILGEKMRERRGKFWNLVAGFVWFGWRICFFEMEEKPICFPSFSCFFSSTKHGV